ncbi:MAG: hypothetical protein FJZ97_02920 [Chloroflexi bacterium]|nr:hypothetical protein [Chloroflexota bacterium]
MTSADWTGLYGLLEPFLREGSWWLLAAPVIGFLGRSNGSLPGMKAMRPEARLHALEHELERLRMVIRKTASMNATLSYDRVLEMVLDVSASAIANGSPEDRRLVCCWWQATIWKWSRRAA